MRVGIDSTSGDWHAPVNEKTREFVFVPIPDCPYNPSGSYIENGKRTYEDVQRELDAFASECCGNTKRKYFELPRRLRGSAMHLDPNFYHLTYGDSGNRGRPLANLGEQAVIAFYAALKSIQSGRLIYALIGVLSVSRQCIYGRSAIQRLRPEERLKNAHSSWLSASEDDRDVILYGNEIGSGLFRQCIEIGQKKGNGQYYVIPELLKVWGGFSNSEEGWLQRSGNLLRFREPERFRAWLDEKKPMPKKAQYRAN